MKSRLAVLLALVAVPIAGCGGGGGGNGNADPAKLVPAAAPVYAEVTARPSGSQRDGAEAALRKLLHTDDPDAKLRTLADKALKSSHLTWADVRPWLGKRVGLFITAFRSNHVQGAAVLATTDTSKARDTLEKDIKNQDKGEKPPKVSDRTYRGVSFSYDSANDNAAGIVDGYAVTGSLTGFQQAVDVAKGGKAITSDADFGKARAAAGGGDALGFAWADSQGLLDAAFASNKLPTASQAAVRQLVAQFGRTLAGSLHATGDAVRLDVVALGAPSNGGSGHGADALAGLPSDAWLAVGLGDVGKGLSRGVRELQQLGDLGGGQVRRALDLFRSRTGIDVQRDLASWMGDGALYARGHSIADLGVVFTVSSTDAAKSVAAVGRIARALRGAGAKVRPTTVAGYDAAVEVQLPGLPVSVFMAGSGKRFSIGLNPQALADVAHPTQTLSSSPAYAAAQKSLGDGLRPVAIVDTQTIIGLLETFGVGSDQQFGKAKPYLDAIGVIAAGAQRQGDVAHGRLAVALK